MAVGGGLAYCRPVAMVCEGLQRRAPIVLGGLCLEVREKGLVCRVWGVGFRVQDRFRV